MKHQQLQSCMSFSFQLVNQSVSHTFVREGGEGGEGREGRQKEEKKEEEQDLKGRSPLPQNHPQDVP